MANDKHPPPIIWAERSDRIYLTVNLEDCKDLKIEFEPTKMLFSCTGGIDKKEYGVTLEFHKDIVPEESHYAELARHIPMIIKKKDDGPYWTRLMKGPSKVHWIKTDFNKWRDEDDSDVDEADDMQFENMMKKMGNFNTQDVTAPGVMDEEDDSDDEELPDLA